MNKINRAKQHDGHTNLKNFPDEDILLLGNLQLVGVASRALLQYFYIDIYIYLNCETLSIIHCVRP